MKNMLIGLLIGFSAMVFLISSKIDTKRLTGILGNNKDEIFCPPCVQMYNSIEKYSTKYNIPKDFAYGIAYNETRYEGPLHWKYEHAKISSAGAVGPMQIMYPTAKFLFPERNFTTSDLKTNIDFNVECSMKLLRYLHDTYHDWKTVFGAYNTGSPMINDYALQVYNFKRQHARKD